MSICYFKSKLRKALGGGFDKLNMELIVNK